jgi:hypothetical protein
VERLYEGGENENEEKQPSTDLNERYFLKKIYLFYGC